MAGRASILVGALAILAALALLTPDPGLPRDGERPNVIIFLTDDQRKRGTMQVMPKTRRIFAQGGTRFSRGFVTTPQCCPSRASIYSGQYTHNHGVVSNRHAGVFDHQRSWQRHLQAAGYRTALYGKFLNGWGVQPVPYFDDVHMHGRWDNPPLRDRMLGERAIDYISEAEAGGEPWAVMLSLTSPHAPFVVEPSYRQAPVGPFKKSPAVRERDHSDKHPRLNIARRDWAGDADRALSAAQLRRRQLKMLMTVDDVVADVWRAIERRGAAERTLAFFLSDNGLYWGEHGLRGKYFPYLDSARVPMYARWDGHFAAGATDHRFALNIDLAPTIYDAVGIDPATAPDGYQPDGRSLLDPGWERDWILLEGPESSTRSSWPQWRHAFFNGRHHFLSWRDGLREHYNLRRDPFELQSTVDPDRPPAQRRRQLRWLTSTFGSLVNAVRDCRGPQECP